MTVATVDGDYCTASEAWEDSEEGFGYATVGQLGGEPSWIQGEETPDCASCAAPVTFVAQLEEGRDHTAAANFGRGSAYAFACYPCTKAAFLWQC